MSEIFYGNSEMEQELKEYEDILSITDYKPIKEDVDSIDTIHDNSILKAVSSLEMSIDMKNNNNPVSVDLHKHEDSMNENQILPKNLYFANDKIEKGYYEEHRGYYIDNNIQENDHNREEGYICDNKDKNVDCKFCPIAKPKSQILLKNVLKAKTKANNKFLPSAKKIDKMSNLSIISEKYNKTKKDYREDSALFSGSIDSKIVNREDFIRSVEKLKSKQASFDRSLFLDSYNATHLHEQKVSKPLNRSIQTNFHATFNKNNKIKYIAEKAKYYWTHIINAQNRNTSFNKYSPHLQRSLKNMQNYDSKHTIKDKVNDRSIYKYKNVNLSKKSDLSIKSRKIVNYKFYKKRSSSVTSLNIGKKQKKNKNALLLHRHLGVHTNNIDKVKSALKSLPLVRYKRNAITNEFLKAKINREVKTYPNQQLIDNQAKNNKTTDSNVVDHAIKKEQIFKNSGGTSLNTTPENTKNINKLKQWAGFEASNYNFEDFVIFNSHHYNSKMDKYMEIASKLNVIPDNVENDKMKKDITGMKNNYAEMASSLQATNYHLNKILLEAINENQVLSQIISDENLVKLYTNIYKTFCGIHK